MSASDPFPRLISEAMARGGLGLRELCRRARIDPSFFSKVLAGKRNPPAEEEPLRRLAAALELDPVEVIVAAGRIPTDWSALWADPELVRAVHAVASGRRGAVRRPPSPSAVPVPAERASRAAPPSRPAPAVVRGGLSEELL